MLLKLMLLVAKRFLPVIFILMRSFLIHKERERLLEYRSRYEYGMEFGGDSAEEAGKKGQDNPWRYHAGAVAFSNYSSSNNQPLNPY